MCCRHDSVVFAGLSLTPVSFLKLSGLFVYPSTLLHRPHYIHCRPTTCTNCNDPGVTHFVIWCCSASSLICYHHFLFIPCVSSFHQTWKRNVVELSDCGIHIGTPPVFASCCRGSATRLHFCREEGQLPDSCLLGWLTVLSCRTAVEKGCSLRASGLVRSSGTCGMLVTSCMMWCIAL